MTDSRILESSLILSLTLPVVRPYSHAGAYCHSRELTVTDWWYATDDALVHTRRFSSTSSTVFCLSVLYASATSDVWLQHNLFYAVATRRIACQHHSLHSIAKSSTFYVYSIYVKCWSTFIICGVNLLQIIDDTKTTYLLTYLLELLHWEAGNQLTRVRDGVRCFVQTRSRVANQVFMEPGIKQPRFTSLAPAAADQQDCSGAAPGNTHRT